MSKYLNYFNKLYEEQQRQKKKQELKLIKSQLELLKLLASGLTIRKIAVKLNKKYENIKKRTQNLYFKLGAVDRYWLIKLAIEYELITTKDVKPRFRKRFNKQEIDNDIILENIEELNEREIEFLKLLSKGKTHNEIIQTMNLYGTYPVWELRRNVCAKLDCESLTRAVYVAKRLEII